MSDILGEWSWRWNVPPAAIQELRAKFGLAYSYDPNPGPRAQPESVVQSRVRLEAARKDIPLWRNNRGAGFMASGSCVRFGLANDSNRVNNNIKSHDLIGIKRIIIQPRHVGMMIGQFMSREIKKEGWRYTGDEDEVAQLRWLELVVAYGGDACFTTGEGSL
jgi:hypothetical protein